MNTRLHFVVVSSLLAVQIVATFSCAATSHSPLALPAGHWGAFDPVSVRGANRNKVVEVLGPPSHAFNANVWVYFDFRAQPAPENAALDTLVVVFDGNKVMGMKLAEGRLIRELIAQRAGKSDGMRTGNGRTPAKAMPFRH